MLWLVILVALAIPLAAVVLDSPVVRAMADRARQGSNPGIQGLPAADIKHLEDKVETLETELEAMNREITHLKESQAYFQQMLEDPSRRDPAKLPKPKD